MTDPSHRHPASVAFDRFRDDPDYAQIVCVDRESLMNLEIILRRLFCEGWLAAGIAVKNAVDGTQ